MVHNSSRSVSAGYPQGDYSQNPPRESSTHTQTRLKPGAFGTKQTQQPSIPRVLSILSCLNCLFLFKPTAPNLADIQKPFSKFPTNKPETIISADKINWSSLEKWANSEELSAEDKTARSDLLDHLKQECQGFDNETQTLIVKQVRFINNTSLDEFPQNVKILEDLNIRNNYNLKKIGDNVIVQGNVLLGNCTALHTLPKSFSVIYGSIELNQCNGLFDLAFDEIGKDIDTLHCQNLRSLHIEHLGGQHNIDNKQCDIQINTSSSR